MKSVIVIYCPDNATFPNIVQEEMRKSFGDKGEFFGLIINDPNRKKVETEVHFNPYMKDEKAR